MEKTTWDNVGQHFTADGHLITKGLKVWNYDYRQTEVMEPDAYGNPAEPQWFWTTDGGLFDGSRLTVRKPF